MAKKEESAWILDRWIKEEEKIQRVRLNRKS